MEKKLVNNLFNGGVKIESKLFEKKIKPIKKLTKQKIIAPWFKPFGDDKYDIIITGGIGDVVAIESFLFKRYQNRIGNLLLATRGFNEITLLFKEAYPEINIINLFPKFPDNFYAFMSAKNVLDHLYGNEYFNKGIIDFEQSDNQIIDFSIMDIFSKINDGFLSYNGSVFTERSFVDIDKFGLPVEYISVVTTSNRDPIHKARGRNLTNVEIDNVIKVCSDVGLPGVCVYCNCESPNKNLIHIKQCNPLESLEMVKNSKAYIGIDSWLATVASFVFTEDNIKIKGFNDHNIKNRNCYYPPATRLDLYSPNFLDVKTMKLVI